eukprot:8976786-Alexandrium_andersonii.AAC.1
MIRPRAPGAAALHQRLAAQLQPPRPPGPNRRRSLPFLVRFKQEVRAVPQPAPSQQMPMRMLIQLAMLPIQ